MKRYNVSLDGITMLEYKKLLKSIRVPLSQRVRILIDKDLKTLIRENKERSYLKRLSDGLKR